MVSTLTPDWHTRWQREAEENERLRAELDEARAKYDALLEASLQQMASRLDPPLTVLIQDDSPSSSLSSLSSSLSSPLSTLSPLSQSSPATPTPLIKTLVGIINSVRGKGQGQSESKGQKLQEQKEEEFVRASSFHLAGGLTPFYQHLPRLPVCPLVSRNHMQVAGPMGPAGPVIGDDSGSAHYMDIVAGKSISTYPHIPGNPNRDGDPIADRFAGYVYENRVVAAVADGCNWGAKPKEAAHKANAAFIEFVNSTHDSITDVKKAGQVLLQAFEYAHNSIMEGKLAFWEAGTTTLLGGVLLEINKGNDKFIPQWEFVCASVGDCKAFLYSNGEITDITQGNRQNTYDPRDCGGRLGPHLDEGKPDLRNLNLFCAPCMDGDLIIIVTDGVHDNLDPQHLGKVPKDLPKEFNLTGDKWDEVDAAKATYAKTSYTTELLQSLLATSSSTSSSQDEVPPTPTPKEVADIITAHCIQVTQKSRDYMESNQGKRLPEDYVQFPGKMDHTTCLCFRVGRFPTLPEKGAIASGSSLSSPLSTPLSSSGTSLTPSLPPSASLLQFAPSPTMSPRDRERDDGSPRMMGSPGTSLTHSSLSPHLSPKFGDWTKISPSSKH